MWIEKGEILRGNNKQHVSIILCLYGLSVFHAGIYVPRPWYTNSDLDAQAYQNELDSWNKKGYRTVALNGQNRFAVIWEQD